MFLEFVLFVWVDSLVLSISAFMMPATVFLGGYLADHIPIRYIFYFSGTWAMLMGLAPLFSKEVRGLKKFDTGKLRQKISFFAVKFIINHL